MQPSHVVDTLPRMHPALLLVNGAWDLWINLPQVIG
jgi:hypothetical protein